MQKQDSAVRYVLSSIFSIMILLGIFMVADADRARSAPAEGQLSEYLGLNGMTIYPGDEISIYPTDGMPFYPGDENWDGRFNYLKRIFGGLSIVAARNENDIYIAGNFKQFRGIAANHIAHWNGSNWESLGSGLNGEARAIAIRGSDVYIGGIFTMAGRVPANNIARWDGSQWHSLGSGVEGFVNTIAFNGSNVYVGGSFNQAGGIVARYIARWDGSQWHPLGSGVNSVVTTIAMKDSDLFAGGYFTTAGEVAVNRIARWDGSQWHSLGEGLRGPLTEIAVSRSDVYAAGSFYPGEYPDFSYLARWDGSQWHDITSDLGSFKSITSMNGDLFAVGWDINHKPAGDYYMNGIARWDGEQWRNLGSGLTHMGTEGDLYSAYGVDLAVDGQSVYVVGSFSYAGNKVSPDLAIWRVPLELALNYPSGAPGSAFTVRGSNYPANTEITPFIFWTPLEAGKTGKSLASNALMTDANGDFEFILLTDPNAQPGHFEVMVAVGGKSMSSAYELVEGGELRPPENDDLPVLDVPVDLPYSRNFMPLIRR